MIDVFEIIVVSQISPTQWSVKGRAWQTITIGDTVYTAVGRYYTHLQEGDTVRSLPVDVAQPQRYPFVVKILSTYRREIDVLYAGLTGEIVLQGDHGEALKETKLLVKT